MKTTEVPRWGMRTLIGILIIFGIFSAFIIRYKMIYKSIDVKISDNVKVEYGSANYKVEDIIDDVSGDKVNVIKNVNTNILGQQKVILEVSKGNIVKEIPINIEVVDSEAPIINIKNDVVTINVGNYYDVKNNIVDVVDKVDGALEFVKIEDVNDSMRNYYTISNYDFNTVGDKNVLITAVDKFGNRSTRNIVIKVVNNSNGKEKSLSAIAYSLLGSPYVSGGTTPSGFDCSGFVQYVYARAGLKVSRSASTQLYDGQAVSYNNIRVGDIIVWGYGSNAVTHTAIYVGNGKMIHAATPAEGVIINNVAGWGDYSGVHIVSIRRIK